MAAPARKGRAQPQRSVIAAAGKEVGEQLGGRGVRQGARALLVAAADAAPRVPPKRLPPRAPGPDPPGGSRLHPLAAGAEREMPLDRYRNIGIMAHIDAGKVRAQHSL